MASGSVNKTQYSRCVCVCADPSGRASSRPLIGAAERLIRLLGTFEFTGIQLGRVMSTDNWKDTIDIQDFLRILPYKDKSAVIKVWLQSFESFSVSSLATFLFDLLRLD